MRINSLALENITSLRGEHFIDFDRISKESDLFAITGPTGSGKSTLLTAMTMALYGDHFKKLTASDLVSMGSPYGKIKVEFSIGQDRYKIFWHCQVLKKDGTPRKTPTISKELTKNGTPFEEEVENIIGLNFSQFSKVVVLNQGQFADFLTASFTHRKDLLERLLENHNLKDLAKTLRARISYLEKECEHLQAQGDTARLLDEEDLKNLLSQIQDLKKANTDDQELVKTLDGLKIVLKEVIDLEKNKLSLGERKVLQIKALKELEEIRDTQTKTHKLKKDQKNQKESLLQKKRPILQEALKNKNQILETNRRTKELEKEKEYFVKKSDSLEQESQKLEKQSIEVTKNLKDISKKVENFSNTQLENVLKSLRLMKKAYQDILMLKERKKELNSQKEQAEEKAKEYQNTSLAIWKNFQEKLPPLKEISPEGKDWSKCEKEARALLEREENSLQQLEKLSVEKKHLDIQEKENLQKIKDSTEELKGLLKQMEENEAQLAQTTKDLKVTEESLAREEKLLKQANLLQLAYQELVKGSEWNQQDENAPCPVCSTSFDNKYWKKLFEENLNETGREQQENVIQGLVSKKEKLEKKKANIQADLHHQQKSKIKIEDALKELKQQDQKLAALIKALEEKITQGTNLNYEDLSSLKEELYQLQSNQKSCQELRELWGSAHKKFQLTDADIEKKENEYKTERLTLLDNLPSPKEFEKDAFGDEDHLEESIEDLRESLNKQVQYQEKVSYIKEQSLKNSSDKEDAAKQITQKKEAIQKLSQHLTSLMNEATLKNYPEDPEKELNSLEEDLKNTVLEWEKIQKDLQESEIAYQKKQTQLSNIDEQVEVIQKLLIGHRSKIQQIFEKDLLKMVEQYLMRSVSRDDSESFLKGLQKLQKRTLDQENGHNQEWDFIEEFYESIFLPQFDLIQKQFEVNKTSLIEKEGHYKQHLEQEKKIAKIAKKRDRLLKHLGELQELEHFVGKDAFRDFALQVLEEHLLELANNEIDSLADGRYQLLHATAGRKSEFLVKDFWQGGVERKVSTLSGGETFLLSLGLALGLSEMSRGQTEIESFFIDEGFGTLDEESIGQVLDCLMALHSRGKQIGLISHVKGLTEQIPVRIELTKNNFGESTLSYG